MTARLTEASTETATLLAGQVIDCSVGTALAHAQFLVPSSPVTSDENVGKKLISFVIPVYRNERAVSLTCAKIVSLFKSSLPDLNYEIVFVDDGSDDGSLDELLHLQAQNEHVKVLELTRNFGQVPAIMAGLSEIKGDAMINVSADLQDPIELVEEMIRQWMTGSEVVICYRTNRKDGAVTKFMSSLAWSFIRSAIPQMPAGGFDFFLLDREAVDAFNSVRARNRFMQGEVLSLGYRTNYIPYTRQQRTIGKSQWTLDKKLKYFIDAMIDSSYLPIRLMSAMGIFTAVSGFLYAVIVVIAWFEHSVPFTGWAPIIIVMLIIGGMIMFMLGVIGEYVWRIFDEVKGKPRYIIRRKHHQSL